MQANGALQVTVAPILIPLPADTITVFLQNNGPNDIYLGVDVASCTAALGIKVLSSGGELSIDTKKHNLYAACPGGLQVSPADLRWFVGG